MNRAIIITIGALIILTILGVWVYLMLFGTPRSSGEVFTNLGFSPSSQGTTVSEQPGDSAPIESLVDTTTGKLRQLTTRPVAGYSATTTALGPTVRYAERGTGHIYEINLTTGAETIIGRTTVPQVAKAYFSPDARSVALVSYTGAGSSVFAGTITEGGELNGTNLEPGAENIAFLDASTIRYTVVSNGGTIGYQQNLTAGSRKSLFSLSFNELNVDWGPNLSDIYLSTKPTNKLLGYIYTTDNNVLTPVTSPAYGLSALISEERQVLTYRTDSGYASAVHTAAGTVALPTLSLREKCTFNSNNNQYVWCGAPLTQESASVVEDWYKGLLSFNDYIWLIDTDTQSAELRLSPEKEIGRSVDMIDLHMNNTGSNLFFKNKTDQTLWLYDLTAT